MSYHRVKDSSVIVNAEGKYLNIPFEKMERHIWVEDIDDAQIFHTTMAGYYVMKIDKSLKIIPLATAMKRYFKRKAK